MFVTAARTSLPPELAQLRGTTIAGAYRLDGVLGAGNMGVVFSGEQIKLKRPIAVKVLDPAIADSQRSTRRFQREAESVARLDHVNCLQVYDYGTTPDNLHYMVMPRLNGRPLNQLLSDGNLAPRRALRLMAQMLAGLAHAHEQALVHRDLKPSNILVEENGGPEGEVVKIVDFGIAKIVDDEQSFQTRTGMLFGTPAYMSPEQALGEPIDGRSDLYSAGLVLYRMIAGDVPHRAKSLVDQMRRRVTLDVPPLPAPVPEGVNALIARICAREVEDRCTDAHEARAMVLELLEAAPERRDPAWDHPIDDVETPGEELHTLADESNFDRTQADAAGEGELSTFEDGVVDPGEACNERSREVPAVVLASQEVSPETLSRELSVVGARPSAADSLPAQPKREPTRELDDFDDTRRTGGRRQPMSVPELDAQRDELPARAEREATGPDVFDDLDAPAPAGRWSRALVAVAALALAGLGLWWALPQSTDSDQDQEVAIAASPSALGEDPSTPERPAPAPPPAEDAEQGPENLPDPETTPADSLLTKLRKVNLASPDTVLPIAERHALLDELLQNPEVSELVDLRLNAMHDLRQAAEAEQPCAVFVAALERLEGDKSLEARRAVRRASVPGRDGPQCGRARRMLDKLNARPGRRDTTAHDDADEERNATQSGTDDEPLAGAVTPKLGGLK